MMRDIFYKKRSLTIRGNLYDLSRPLVMGILNYTPDSFYDGGKYSDPVALVAHVAGMIDDGADIIDVGAVSTRPGAEVISEDEEMRRLSQVLGIIREKFPATIISLDTFRSEVVMKMASEYGIDMVNDVSAGSLDENMFRVAADLKLPYIAMHMRGTPQTMNVKPVYEEVVNDILKYFADRVEVMRDHGINDIIIDPGFGFGKTVDHNYELAANLEVFKMLELPIMVGFSRKSMVCGPLKVNPDRALTGTIVLNAIAILKGADILRVHDVKEAKQTVTIAVRLREAAGEGSVEESEWFNRI
jgi:dihydropteroate synthase